MNERFAMEVLKFSSKNSTLFDSTIKVFEQQNIFFRTIKMLAIEELFDTHEVFLRGQTIGTLAMRSFQEQNGKAVYQNALMKVFQKLQKQTLHIDVLSNPSSSISDEKRKNYRSKLSKQFNKIMSAITEIPIPLGIAIVCYQVASVLENEEKNNHHLSILSSFKDHGSEQLSVGSILFLYTICPLFISPPDDCAIDKSSEGYRNLVFMAKCLQTLANGCSFQQNGMLEFNYLLDENRTKYQSFALKVIQLGNQAHPHFNVPVVCPFALWKGFYRELEKQIEQIMIYFDEHQNEEYKKYITESISDVKLKKEKNHVSKIEIEQNHDPNDDDITSTSSSDHSVIDEENNDCGDVIEDDDCDSNQSHHHSHHHHHHHFPHHLKMKLRKHISDDEKLNAKKKFPDNLDLKRAVSEPVSVIDKKKKKSVDNSSSFGLYGTYYFH